MTGANKSKGDRAERECAKMLTALTGLPVRRMLGAGRQDDVGDLEGIPDWAIQVANWKNTQRAAMHKSEDAEIQAKRSNMPYSCALVRFNGGRYRVVMTPRQWFAVLKGLGHVPEETIFGEFDADNCILD